MKDPLNLEIFRAEQMTIHMFVKGTLAIVSEGQT